MIGNRSRKRKRKPGPPKRAGRLLAELPKPRRYDREDIRNLRKLLARREGFAGKRISQADLAEILGVARGAVQEWEQGNKNPSGSARRLMEVLELFPIVGRCLIVHYAKHRVGRGPSKKLSRKDFPDEVRSLLEELG